jgi:hypothetical protein
MRSVVLIAPDFPPSNTAGAHRPRLFAKHLPAFGWTPTVVTIRRDLIEGPLDPRLESLVDPALDVVRTTALPIRPVRIVGDMGLRTLVSHAKAIASMARSGPVDAVVLFGPPWFSFLQGPLARRRSGVPYLVDYIDPWMSDWTAAQPFMSKGWLHHRVAKVLEPMVLKSASHVTAVSQGILDDLRARYPWLTPDRMSAMPYGAEPDDLDASARLGVVPPDFRPGTGEVNVCFTGALQPHGTELIRAVLLALRELRTSGSPLASRVRLRLYGTSNLTWGHSRHAVLPLAQEMGVADIVSEVPERIPYLTALAVLRASDVVLVMGSTDRYYHASKLYPAIVSGRPILAICHAQSSIATVMRDTAAGATVTFSDISEVAGRAGEIRRAIETLAAAGPRPVGAAPGVERFTARASTAVLAAALHRMAARPHVKEAV